MVCYQYAPAADGGAERQAQRLAEALVSRGHAVGVVTTRCAGAPTREQLAGVDVYRIWTVSRKGLVSLTFLPALVLFLLSRGRRFDVWHVHQAYYHYLIARWIARLLGKRCIVKAAASGPFGDLARLRTSKLGGIVLRAIPSADAVVSLNRELSRELQQAGVARARVIRNGVDLSAFTPASGEERGAARRALGLASDATVVAFVGRLTHAKGVDTLLDAWRRVEAADAPGRCWLFLAGDGDEGATYRQRATAELRRATFLGRVKDIRPVLRATDILVLPSRSEGLSNAVLEAMAMGVPVLATHIGGLDEQVVDGVTGVLVAPGDAQALADGLGRLLGDAALQRRLGRQGRATAEQDFAFSRTVDAYEQLYQELIA
jgi:glycosyltransferase involved in cell wall biosynthesis